jgi:hypothetical protein
MAAIGFLPQHAVGATERVAVRGERKGSTLPYANHDVSDYGPEDRATPEERESADRVAMIGQIPSAQGQSIPGVGTATPRLSRELFEREYERQLVGDCNRRAIVNGAVFVSLGDPGPAKALLSELTDDLPSGEHVRVPSCDRQIPHGKYSPRHATRTSRPQARRSS